MAADLAVIEDSNDICGYGLGGDIRIRLVQKQRETLSVRVNLGKEAGIFASIATHHCEVTIP